MLVILFGAQAFPKSGRLKSHAAFANAANAFAEYAHSVLKADVRSFFDSPKSWTEQLAEFRDLVASDHGHDTLIVYYVGHGIFPRAGSTEVYALALAETDSTAEHRTSLQVPSLAEDIRAAACSRKIVIVDACFAAASVAHFQSESYVRRLRPSFASVAGTAVLAAASRDDFAKVEVSGESTMFTRALLDVLRQGAPHTTAPFLSLRVVADLLEERIERAGGTRPELHVPSQDKGRVDEAPIFPNLNPARSEGLVEQRPRERVRVRPRQSLLARLITAAITALVAAIVGLVAREFGFRMRPKPAPPQKKYEMASYDHYLALRDWPAPLDVAQRLGLGTLREEVYCEIWSQRFARGSLFHPSLLEVYGEPPRKRDLSNTLFMIARGGASLAHIRPPIQGGVDTLDVFKALLASKPAYADRLPSNLFHARPRFLVTGSRSFSNHMPRPMGRVSAEALPQPTCATISAP